MRCMVHGTRGRPAKGPLRAGQSARCCMPAQRRQLAGASAWTRCCARRRRPMRQQRERQRTWTCLAPHRRWRSSSSTFLRTRATPSTSLPGPSTSGRDVGLVGPTIAPPAAAAAASRHTDLASDNGRLRVVGVLRSVPHVVAAPEHLASARKRAGRLVPTAGLKNEAARARNLSARRLDTLMKELSVPLGRYVDGFPDPARLHPFESALLQLTVGAPLYSSTLERVDRLRRAVQEAGKGYASRAGNAPSKATAVAAGEEGAEGIEAVFQAGAKHVCALKDIAMKLRSLPSLDPRLPTLALVGAPNVGKSSLVQVLSSGTPEVCNYPFTTRSIKMGHFYLDGQRHQVTDTPGLLARPDSERNKMEQLTLAALAYLPSAVLFVMDLSEECGTSAADQWAIRSELRARFPSKPWIDVFTKADMPLVDACLRAAELGRRGLAHEGAGVGTEAEAAQALLAATVAGGGHSSDGEAGGESSSSSSSGAVDSPEELAAALPGAMCVSSVTQQAIPQLQLAIIAMLRAQRAAAAAAAAAASVLQPRVGLGFEERADEAAERAAAGV